MGEVVSQACPGISRLELIFLFFSHLFIFPPSCFISFLCLIPLAHQAPQSMGFPRQEYWNRLPFLSPGDLPNPGMEPRSPALQADSLPLNRQGVKWSEVKGTESCLTLCDPMDCTVHGILQAIILEWVAFPFSSRSSQPRDPTQVSHISGRFFTSWATREALQTKGKKT